MKFLKNQILLCDSYTTIIKIGIHEIINYINKEIIVIPEFQRDLQEDKIINIYEKYINSYKAGENYFIKHGYTLCLSHIANDDKYYIVDGQHRIETIKRLYKDNYNFDIIVRLSKFDDLHKIQEDFALLNTNSDLPPIYKCFENKLIKKIILETRNYLRKNYKNSFNESKTISNRTKRMHIDNFVNILDFQKVKDLYINNEKEFGDSTFLIDKIEDINNKVKNHIENHINFYVKEFDQNKIGSSKFYLPLVNIKWENNLFIDDNIEYEDIAPKKKKTIPKMLKNKVIKKYYCGCCYVCSEPLEELDVQMGHVIAEANGGETNLSNLRPICKSCNSSMGTSNLEEYKLRYFS